MRGEGIINWNTKLATDALDPSLTKDFPIIVSFMNSRLQRQFTLYENCKSVSFSQIIYAKYPREPSGMQKNIYFPCRPSYCTNIFQKGNVYDCIWADPLVKTDKRHFFVHVVAKAIQSASKPLLLC